MPLTGTIVEQDATGASFFVGDVVQVRCTVTAADGLGAGGRVTLLVETPGVVGQATGVSFQVSPSQCRKAAANSQLGAVSPALD